MLIKQVSLNNFRNYTNASLELSAGLNVVLGENAQGKTNFLEAVELLANARSSRTISEIDFIKHGSDKMHIEMLFSRANNDESLALSLLRSIPYVDIDSSAEQSEHPKVQKREIRVNGVSYALLKKLRGRLIVVTFNSGDLHLLRGGPAFRRDWLDSVIMRLKPSYPEQLNKYQKIVQQRNRLLKSLWENEHISGEDSDQIDVWSEQVARHGASVIRWRLKTLRALLAKVQYYLALFSDHSELLALNYRCQSLKHSHSKHRPLHNYHDIEIIDLADITHEQDTIQKVEDHEEQEIFADLLYSLNKRKPEEIARGQTLSGPHRDDIVFLLNSSDATAFASQGQQRSIVLALKLAELDLISDHLLEPPVLLLDDVLAELDPKRQSILMSQIGDTMQTIISTTHLSGFSPDWLSTANFYQVKSGTISPVNSQVIIDADRAKGRESKSVR